MEWNLFLEGWVGQHDQKKGQNCCRLGCVCLNLCLRMKLSTIIVFCCLILGLSSQGWRTFLRETGQGKDPSTGLEEAASAPPRFHLSRGHIPTSKGHDWVEGEHCFHGRCSLSFPGHTLHSFVGIPRPEGT